MQPKYWCKHCSTYVKDTPFERKQHENTGKHQGNLKRFLRDIQNKHERDERDQYRAKIEVDRLNQRVGGAPGLAPLIPQRARKDRPSSKIQPSLADRKRQLAQLAELGVEIPEEERGDLALAGKWTTMSEREVVDFAQGEPLSTGVRKRRFEDEDEHVEESISPQRRRWGVTTKRYSSQAKPDLDTLLSTSTLPKVERESVKLEDDPELSTVVAQIDDAASSGSGNTVSPSKQTNGMAPSTKEEDIQSAIRNLPEAEPAAPIFRKRKAKAAGV